MKRLFLAFVSLAALSSAAAAADLPRPAAPQPYYKAPAYVPAYSWTGFYIGVNGGGGFGRSDWDSTGSFDISGGLVGGTLGRITEPAAHRGEPVVAGFAAERAEVGGGAVDVGPVDIAFEPSTTWFI